MNFNIDVTIVVAFLILNLCVGLFYSQKVNNIKDYALGRGFNTPTLVSTIVATWISGSLFFLGVSETYSHGTIFILINIIGNIIAFLVIAFVFAPRMREFIGTISVASAMDKLYGKEARVITAFCGIISVAGYIAVQFKINATVFSYFLDINDTIILAATAIIVAIYSAFGGIRAVTFTDALQFITFGVMLPGIALIMWGNISSINQILDIFLINPTFNYEGLLPRIDNNISGFINTFVFIAIPWLTPAIFQRIAVAKNIRQIKNSFFISSIICAFVNVIISWIAILMVANNPNIGSQNILPHIIENYSFLGLKGIIIIGVTAMVMSTIDSFINSSSILFANDICKGLNLEEKTVMMISRAFAIFITLASLLLAFKYNNLISLILSSASFYSAIVSVPLILAILGFRSTKKSLLIGMSASFCAIVLWKIFSPENGIDSVIPGMLVNLVFFIGSHYILKQEGGWKRNFNKNGSQKRKTQAKQVKSFSFLEICHKNTPKSESTYMFVSIFCIITVFSGMYSIPLEKRLVYNEIIEIIYHSVLVITTLWLIYPLWPQGLKGKGFVFIFWLFSLLYILSFVVGLQVLISDFGYFQLVILLLSMTVLSIVARWEISLVLMIFGIIASIQFFKYYTGNNISANFGSVQFKILYILMMVFGILIAFFKPKQDHQEATEAKVDVLEEEVTHLETKVSDLNETVIHYSERISDQEKEIERLGATAQRILNNVNHEFRLPVGNVMNFAEMLNDGLGKLNENQLKMLSDEVYKNSNRLSSMIMNMLDLATLEAKKIELDKKKINLGELVEDRINNCRKIYLDNKKIEFVLKIDTEILISVDPNYMRQVVDNLLINSIKFSSEGIICVELLKKKGLIEFKIKDNGIGIPKEELYDIFTPFKMGSNTQSKAEGRGVGLALCKAAIEAHGGSITAESSGVGAAFKFVL